MPGPGSGPSAAAGSASRFGRRYTGAIMDAAPLLAEVGRQLREVGLEAVLIGNGAAALQGAPVTTIDFDCGHRQEQAGRRPAA